VTLPLVKYKEKGPLDSSKPVPYPACPSCLSESDPPLKAIIVALSLFDPRRMDGLIADGFLRLADRLVTLGSTEEGGGATTSLVGREG